MTITQVLYALETARCQNVSKAAERMFVSQPALSAQLGKLEEELGCKLFRRGHQGVSLTAAGVSFCQTAEAVEASRRAPGIFKTPSAGRSALEWGPGPSPTAW